MKIFNYLSVVLMASAAMISCSDEKENGGSGSKKFDATITPTTTITEGVAFGAVVEIEATVEASKDVAQIILTGVKAEGESYTAVGEAQAQEGADGAVKVEFIVDSKEITDIEFKVATKDAESAIAYIAVGGGVTGDSFTAYANENVLLYANGLVKNHENSPEEYPEDNTSAESPMKSFFSIHGVEIDGKKEHILSLDEARSVDGTDVSFTFLNVLQNTANNAFIGSQRGYTIYGLRNNLSAGTIGRHCDEYEVNGHKIDDANNSDDMVFQLVRGSWKADREDVEAAAYAFIDKLYLDLGKAAETNLDKIKQFNALEQIQVTMDNATLGEIDNPTSIGGTKMLRQRVNAGTTATADITETFRAGDYLILRSKRGSAEEPVYYYGIALIKAIPDDSAAFNEDGRIDQEKAFDLFGKAIVLDIRCQIEE